MRLHAPGTPDVKVVSPFFGSYAAAGKMGEDLLQGAGRHTRGLLQFLR